MRTGGGAAAVNERVIQLSATRVLGNNPNVTSAVAITWSTSNANIATVSATGLVTAVGPPGRATITAAAADGSGRRATTIVNVGVPASSLNVQGRGQLGSFGEPTLAFGRSLQMSAVAGTAYGRVTDTRVSWEREVFRTTPGGLSRAADLDSHVSITSAGRLTVNNSMMQVWRSQIGSDELVVRVRASALDGSGVTNTRDVRLCPPTQSMRVTTTNTRIPINVDRIMNIAWGWGQGNNFWGNYHHDYLITSSNPRVVRVRQFSDAQGNPISQFQATGVSRGTSTIRVVSNDGTNRAATITITVP